MYNMAVPAMFARVHGLGIVNKICIERTDVNVELELAVNRELG